MRQRLFTPGPTPIPDRVVLAMSQAMPYHRGPAFKELFAEVSAHLQYIFQTQSEVLLLTASGTGGMEACVANLLLTGQKALVIVMGKFSARWQELCHAYGIETVVLNVPWGKAPDLADVKMMLQRHADVAAVFCTHTETSTGVDSDVGAIAELVHTCSDALVIVDGITSVGVVPFYMDDWKIDVCITSSQKGLMAPPGLAFVALGERTLKQFQAQQWDEMLKKRRLPRYYWDFAKALEAAKDHLTTWTPAITLVMGLRESLRMIHETGLKNLWNHYLRLGQAMRAGVKEVGLELFAEVPSNALTTVKVPPIIESQKLIEILREQYGVMVAGGQGPLKGKIIRIAHMGYHDHLDMMALMSALELALAALGWRFELGAGVARMQQIYARDSSGVVA
ncbi:MAG: alanine--glyoxylate aminotransferase family protein [candidate division KSB1 bacterium]|nr:alanine--glyoxylate aminotransferase family protein [candidate division KSB1 bacterium]MDZ7305139.1 alanine--glyoxylate aminotransferase family protein [candidate division KSB1 bacterium]MDZ7314223.1 alanine--glyoxylate aminotransferase family protein [candidate division KSB1 bacterium]